MTDTPTPATPPAAPAVDDKGLRRIGYILGGMTIFSGLMAIFTGVASPQTPAPQPAPVARATAASRQQNTTAANSRRMGASAPRAYAAQLRRAA